MKISMCTPMFLPVVGGAENYVHDLTQFLTRKNYDVEINTLNLRYWKKANYPQCINDSYSIFRFNVGSFSNISHRLFMVNFPIPNPKLLIEKSNPDILHFHNMTDFTFPVFLNSINTPKILTCHTLYESANSIKRRIFFLSKVINKIDCLHVFSELDQLLLVNKFQVNEQKISIIPHGVDLSTFKKAKIRNGDTILFVGRIHPSKGIKTLISACKKIQKKLKLWIVGPISNINYYNELLSLIKKSDYCKITFFGKVNRKKLIDLYSKCDVFVLPSYSETSPLTILEAMANSLPIIASNVGGIPSLITHGYNGFLIEPDDCLTLSNRLEHLLNNESVRINFGKRNRIIVENKHDINTNYEQIEKLYLDFYKN